MFALGGAEVGTTLGRVSSKLVLLAASGLALEAAEAARAAGREVLGCLDDNRDLWGTTLRGWLPVLPGGIDALGALRAEHDVEQVVCAGRGQVRRAIVQRLAAAGVLDGYASVVHPSVAVSPSCDIAGGSIFLAGCVLTAQVTVGTHVVCMPNVVLTHDDAISDYATLCAGVVLGGSVQVGEAAYVGMGASVRENLVVGAGSTLGMGSVLVRDLPAGQTWAGVPARLMET